MRKLIASVLFLSVVVGFTGCSSDDNAPIRKKAAYEGTWESDKLRYTFGDREFEHDYSDFGNSPGNQGNEEVVIKEIITLEEDKATLVSVQKNGVELPAVKGEVKDEVISFEGLENRKITGATETELALTYDFTMMGQTLPVTVTYKRK